MKKLFEDSAFSRAISQLGRRVREFHDNEEGLNIIEIILILFIAVVILVALAAFFNQSVWAKVKSAIDELMGTTF